MIATLSLLFLPTALAQDETPADSPADTPEDTAVEAAPVQPSTATAKPAKTPKTSTSPIGLHAEIGPAFTQAGESLFPSPQPGSSFGAGGRVSVGALYKVDDKLGLRAELGYHNFFGKPGDAEGALEPTPEYTLEGDRMHFGYIYAAGTYAINQDIRLAGGPLWGMGTATVTGLNSGCVQNPSSADCAGVTADREGLRYTRSSGPIMAAGGAAGATYSFSEAGPFRLGASLYLGAMNDSARWYPFGQLAFTMSPML